MPRRVPADIPPGTRVRIPGLDHVTVSDKLGSGSFGAVYAVRSAHGDDLAMKVEPCSTTGTSRQLAYENRVYRQLRSVTGIPRVHGFDPGGPDRPAYLVMDRLGRSLEDVRRDAPGHQLPLRYVFLVTIRVLDRLRDIHANGLLHRDVKPANFLLGSCGERLVDVWAVDMGLVKSFRDRWGVHIPARDDKRGLTGTPRFASPHVHRGHEHGRRDDLESLLYVAAYLFRGSLPWQRITKRRPPDGAPDGAPDTPSARAAERLRRNALILESKVATAPERLFRGMGPEILECAALVGDLPFEAEPDYAEIRRLLLSGYRRCQRQHATDSGGN